MTSTGSIIALGPDPWTGPWMNRQQVLSRLAARGWSVVYAQRLFFTWERGSERWREAPWLPSAEIHDRVVCAHPGRLSMTTRRLPALDGLSRALYARHLRRHAGSRRPRILYVFGPTFADYVDDIDHDALVYHAFDAFGRSADDSGAARTLEAEDRMLRRADVVLASSEQIAAPFPARGGTEPVVFPNGCDFDAYGAPAGPEPPDLAGIPHPRLAYIGRVNKKTDLALVDAVAAARPGWHWVFVGEVLETVIRDAGQGDCLDRLRGRPNVHFLGHKPHTALPAYAQAMDVLTMLYATDRDGFWQSCYPLKMHEYLATGKPVVSAPLAAVRPFSHVIDLRAGAEDWINGIGAALADTDPARREQRRQVARENSWDSRIDTLETILRRLTPGLPDGVHRAAGAAPRPAPTR